MRSDQEHHIAGQLIDQGIGQVDHRFLDVRLRQSHHLLTGRYHLPGLGAPLGDHGFMVGAQLGVAQLVLALVDGRPGLIEGGLGGFEVRVGLVELRLRADPTIKQGLLAQGTGLGIDQLRLNFRQVALGRTQLVLLVGRVEGGEQRTLLHLGADIDVTAGDSPVHAEAGIAFIARLDATGEAAQVLFTQGLDLDRQHRPYRRRRRFVFGTGAQHQPDGQRP
ncbi:hypothetical protein D9M72_498400 [compost metagenome]